METVTHLLYLLGVVMVVEGIYPFAHPSGWRKMVMIMMQQTDSSIRLVGLISMLFGLGILYVAR